jgi:hypothetical protein
MKSLVDNAQFIENGRRGLDTYGKETEGHASYDKGIAGALEDFANAGESRNCQVIDLAELLFIQQDLQFTQKDDTDAKASLNKGIQDFTDGLKSLEVVKKPDEYKIGEQLFPTYYKYRVEGCPYDAYQIACEGHKLRLKNILRSPGINMKEKAVLRQRLANMPIAQAAYLELQKNALL